MSEEVKKVKKPKSKARKIIEWVLTGIFVALFVVIGVAQIDGLVHKKDHYNQTIRFGYGTFVVETDSMERDADRNKVYGVKSAIITYLDNADKIYKDYLAYKGTDKHIDVTFAKGILTEILKNNKSTVTPDKIKTTVCHKFNLKISEIDSSKRTNKVAYPRQIAMYLCRNLTDYSYTQIGNYFGGRHYTTVMHACEVIQKDIGKNEEKRNLISSLKEEIKA